MTGPGQTDLPFPNPFRLPLLRLPEIPPGTPDSWLVHLQRSGDEPIEVRISAFRAFVRTRDFGEESLTLVDGMLGEFRFELRLYAYYIVTQLLSEGFVVLDSPGVRPLLDRIIHRAGQEPRPELLPVALALRVGLRDPAACDEAAQLAAGETPARYAPYARDRPIFPILCRAARNIVNDRDLRVQWF